MTARTRAMLRLALTPRWLAGALLLIALVIGAIFLGRWQWDRTQEILAAERAAASQPVPISEVFTEGTDALPNEGIGRPVTAEGEYLPQTQVAVANREDGDRPGVWIVTGLQLPDGTVAAIVRGSLPDASAPGAVPPTGDVMVTGVLHPDERFYADSGTPPGTIASVAHDRLAERWGMAVLPGFVMLTDQQPLDLPAPTPVPPTVKTADVPFPLQNFFYAFQWWIFGAFGVVVYVRWLWLESARNDAG